MRSQFPSPGASSFVTAGPGDAPATPLPGAWPLLGHAPALLHDPLAVLARAGRLGPLTVARLGPVRAYLVTDPELIRAILVRDAAHYDKGFQFDALRGLIGDGVGTSGGERHRRNKKLLRPAFDHAAVAGYATDMAAQTRSFLETRWDPAAASGRSVDAAVDLRMLAMRLVTHSMSGSEVAADQVMRELPRMLAGVGRRALLPVRALDRVPTAGNRRFEHSLAAVHALADRMVEDHRVEQHRIEQQRIENQRVEQNRVEQQPTARHRGRPEDAADAETGPATLLDTLLAAVDEDGAGFTDEQAHDEIMTLLLAGTETAAGVMAWTLHVLAGDQELQQRVRDEVLEASGDGGDEPGPLDPRRLALTERVVKEVLRLYPPGWIVGRRTLQDMRLAGATVPARSQVLLNFYGLQRDPAAFPDPDRFDADRWIDPDPAVISAYYLPFGTGPHGCLGEGYAWTEILGAVAAVLPRYRLQPVPGGRVRPVARTTLHPDTVPLRLTRIG
jgi:cytochrome P450